MSRNINRNVTATVDEKYIAAKTRGLFIVSLLLSPFMKINAFDFALSQHAGWKIAHSHACLRTFGSSG
jgi:hypothetical protein